MATMTSSTATTGIASLPAVATPVLTCQNYTTYYYDVSPFCKWLAVNKANVDASATQFVNTQLPNTNLSADMGNITEVYGYGGLNYITNVGWIPGCDAISSQSVTNPIPSDPTVGVHTLLLDVFLNCKSFEVYLIDVKANDVEKVLIMGLEAGLMSLACVLDFGPLLYRWERRPIYSHGSTRRIIVYDIRTLDGIASPEM